MMKASEIKPNVGKLSETIPLEDIYYIFHPKNSK